MEIFLPKAFYFWDDHLCLRSFPLEQILNIKVQNTNHRARARALAPYTYDPDTSGASTRTPPKATQARRSTPTLPHLHAPKAPCTPAHTHITLLLGLYFPPRVAQVVQGCGLRFDLALPRSRETSLISAHHVSVGHVDTSFPSAGLGRTHNASLLKKKNLWSGELWVVKIGHVNTVPYRLMTQRLSRFWGAG